jgi:DNA-binding CsgD family transcriptional regulator
LAVAAEELIRLSNLAVSAALDPGRWQVFLDTLSCSLGTRVCTQLIGYDDLTKATPLTFSSGYDPYILELYDEHYADKNPFAANFATCKVGDVVSTHQLCRPETLKKTQFYADLLLPLEDITGGGGSMLALDGDRMFLLGGNMRSKDRDKYEDDWLRLCAQLAPVIRQSLEINRTISGLTFEKWAAEQHLMGSGTAIFVIDTAMRIHYACAEAQKLLASGSLVGCGFDRRLHFRSEEDQGRFAGFVQLQSMSGYDVFRNWQATDGRGRNWACRSIGLQLGDLDKTPFGVFMNKAVSAVLLAVRPEAGSDTFLAQMQKKLGLSPAEAATVLKLADGRTPAEIAQDREISIYTVRNQIKAALSKTGSRRQAELVRSIEQLRLQGSR